jgi:predicted transcriptional regulator
MATMVNQLLLVQRFGHNGYITPDLNINSGIGDMSVTMKLSWLQKIAISLCRSIKYVLVAVLFFNISAYPALSDNGGYVAYPTNPDNHYRETPVNEGEMRQVSFSELPLWVKLSYLSGGLSILTSLALFLPLGIRKIKAKNDRNRKSILEYISGNPGCSISDLNKREKIPRGTVRYHIDRLVDEEKILLVKAGKCLRLFPKSQATDEKEKMVQSFIRNKNYRKLLLAILCKEGITNQELSENLGMDKGLTYRYIQKLLVNNIIVIKAEGKTKLYYVKEDKKTFVIKLLTDKNAIALDGSQ